MWIFDYLPTETGVILHKKPIQREWNGTKFFIGHGDGLGPGDHSYKFIKRVFKNPALQWAFARLHPNFGIGLADYFSRSSRAKTGTSDEEFFGENEWLAIFCKEVLKKEHFDYFIFGHRHLPMEMAVGSGSTYINLGDWIRYFTFAEFDGQKTELLHYSEEGSRTPADARR